MRYPEEFEELWRYASRKSKKRLVYEMCLAETRPPECRSWEEMVAHTRDFWELEWSQIEPRYRPLMTTWIEDGGFDDEPQTMESHPDPASLRLQAADRRLSGQEVRQRHQAGQCGGSRAGCMLCWLEAEGQGEVQAEVVEFRQ